MLSCWTWWSFALLIVVLGLTALVVTSAPG
jgi:hypothetical protein